MLKVKTYVTKSNIHGLGLFADQDINAGEVLWVYEPRVDVTISEKDKAQLPEEASDFFDRYAYKVHGTELWVLPYDNDRYINHSDTPNVGEAKGIAKFKHSIALTDIKKHDELTCDYKEFDMEHANKVETQA